jgi:chromosome segregation ATPase
LEKIEELNFAKAHLTELIVEKENINHNLDIEKDSFDKYAQDLKEERNMLRDYIEKLTNESHDTQEQLLKENKEYKTKIKELENTLAYREETIKKLSIELEGLKNTNHNIYEKNKTLENTLKLKINECAGVEETNKKLDKEVNRLDQIREELEENTNNMNKEIENLNIQLQNLEKENFELIKKNKNLLMTQENLQSEMMKQNHVYY